MTLYSKENPNQQIFDITLNKEILIGYCNRDAYKIERYKWWFDKWYEKQEPEQYILGKLNTDFLRKIEIWVFAATWCGSCRVEVARFYKIFDILKVSFHNVSVLYLNKQKEIPGLNISEYDIKKVPSFIFKMDSKEIGRIVEHPKDTLEADLLEIQNKIIHP